ncbi:ABC transporter permease [Paraliobacillus zengyii]|uniref:ABC transporter permease n=1 Tax=Paraliobacillus zengyii TaxID=2213194 RepID=UPI000E3D8471|nr:ABC transporter permease [Paraliobacillus zengyii]
MWHFLKKDLLVLVRNRTELILLLLMPFILICILGFALRGLMEGNTDTLNMQVALVEQDEAAEGIEQFKNELSQLAMPSEAIAQIDLAATNMLPSDLLVDVLENDSIKNMIDVIEMDIIEAEKALEDEEVEAILTLPENFTYLTLQKMFLDKGKGSKLEILLQEEGRLQASIFETIIESFTRSVNFESAIAQVTEGKMITTASSVEDLGKVETISTRDPITAFQYYTIAMSVMFALYVASTISSRGYLEKRQHVFNRIILSGKSPVAYLTGKFVSTTAVVCIQLFILFLLSTLIFQSFQGETVTFWLGMLAISFVLAVCVGALAMLLTSITVRYNDDNINTIFSGGIVSLMAFAGGSFVPTSQLPNFIDIIGGLTPNGAAFTAYIKWMQGARFVQLTPEIISILVMATFLFIISLAIFPRRSTR